MNNDRKKLAIIFHSGSYDRIYNGLTVALSALALGRPVTVLFTYWSLEHVRRDKPPSFSLDGETERHRGIIQKNIKQGHLEKMSELLSQYKKLGGILYVCSGSMALLNVFRGSFIPEVDKST
jgi:peroxiredoxin family protein